MNTIDHKWCTMVAYYLIVEKPSAAATALFRYGCDGYMTVGKSSYAEFRNIALMLHTWQQWNTCWEDKFQCCKNQTWWVRGNRKRTSSLRARQTYRWFQKGHMSLSGNGAPTLITKIVKTYEETKRTEKWS